MAPTFPFTSLGTVEVFATEPDRAQLVWRTLGPGVVGAVVDGTHIPLGEGGRAGAADLGGLVPGTTTEVDVTLDSRIVARCTITTPQTLAGPELTRIASISDLHLGEEGFGLVKEMREEPRPPVGYPLRCARAAVREAVEWGAELLVIKGDITELGLPEHWELFDELLADIQIPVLAIPGNHDTVSRRASLDATSALNRRGLFPEPVQIHDLRRTRLVLADTTVPGRSWGRIRHRADALVEAADVDRPAIVFLHHHLHRRGATNTWPPGTPSREATTTLRALGEANPNLLITSGHTHRCRSRRHDRTLITEVGSTKDYPGVWAGYVLHPEGVRQVVRRVADPEALEWTERTREVVGGVWGRWSPGDLHDRCIVQQWTHPFAHAGAELDSLERQAGARG